MREAAFLPWSPTKWFLSCLARNRSEDGWAGGLVDARHGSVGCMDGVYDTRGWDVSFPLVCYADEGDGRRHSAATPKFVVLSRTG